MIPRTRANQIGHTPSMVAIFGWIIPEPFAIPPTLMRVCPTCPINQHSGTFLQKIIITIIEENAVKYYYNRDKQLSIEEKLIKLEIR